MPDLHWNELISAEHLDAFAAMWPQEREAASAEVRRLLDLVSKPTEHLNETRAFARRLLLGLVGEEPDVAAWMQAVAAGGLQLRPEQRYVVMRDREKPARFLERGLETYDHGVTARQLKAGITDRGAKEGMHLVAFLLLAKEVKNLAAGPAAMGPAWPLMVAVDSHLTNEEKRALHRAGADKKLQHALAAALKAALATHASERNDGEVATGSRTANWRRQLPPKTELEHYFETRRLASSEANEAVPLDLASAEKVILGGPRPSFLPADVDQSCPSHELPVRITWNLPRRNSSSESIAKAVRAIARQEAREKAVKTQTPDVYSTDFRVQVWLRSWVLRGGGIPKDIPLIYLGYLEEEACLAFETFGTDWSACKIWNDYGVIGLEPSKNDPLDVFNSEWADVDEVTWAHPPRQIDRIDVSAIDPEVLH